MVATLNGKRYDIPGCWEELKTRQHKALLNWDNDKQLHARDFFKAFCIIADLEFKSFTPTAWNESTIWNAIRWIVETPFEKGELPNFLQYKDKVIEIPMNIGNLSIGQNICVRQELEGGNMFTDKDGNLTDCDRYAEITAIFLQPLIDRNFNLQRAKEIAKDIDDMPAYLIRPIGFFLLTQALNSGRPRMNGLRQILNNLTRIKKKLRHTLRSQTNFSPLQIFGLSESMRRSLQETPMRYLKKPALTL
jgi:hypothetical protein